MFHGLTFFGIPIEYFLRFLEALFVAVGLFGVVAYFFISFRLRKEKEKLRTWEKENHSVRTQKGKEKKDE